MHQSNDVGLVSTPEYFRNAFDLKAECVEWRERCMGHPPCAASAAEKRALLSRAQPLCFAWPLRPDIGVGLDATQQHQLTRWYRLAGLAIVMAESIRTAGRDEGVRRAAFELVARCLSALTHLLSAADVNDTDVPAAHGLLREWAREDGIFVQHHMRRNDPADPAGHEDAEAEISRLASEIHELKEADRAREAMFDELQAAVAKASSETGGAPAPLGGVEAALRALVEVGVPPSSPAVRSILLPLANCQVPPDADPALRAAFRAMKAAPATSRLKRIESSEPQYSERVARVRAMLRGGRLLIVGGEPRPESNRRLEAAFECTVQHEPAEHVSILHLQSEVASSTVVALLIKLSSHSNGPDLVKMCQNAGRPLVRLTAGYGVEQMAAAIIDQASRRLTGQDN